MTTQLWGISSSIWKPETQLRYLHFLPYLEPPSTSLWSSQLVRFWLDVESFRCSASMVITSSWAPPRVSRERLDRFKVNKFCWNFCHCVICFLVRASQSYWAVSYLSVELQNGTRAIPIALFSLGGKHIAVYWELDFIAGCQNHPNPSPTMMTSRRKRVRSHLAGLLATPPQWTALTLVSTLGQQLSYFFVLFSWRSW